jgi:uncharacterized membrane protein YccC
MSRSLSWSSLTRLIRAEYHHLTAINSSDRRWQMPFAAALSSGLPLLIGAWFGHMDYGLISSLGGMVFLYLPETPMHHRMGMLMGCTFAMIAAYTLGLAGHLLPALTALMLAVTALLVTMVCRYYHMGPPGSFFFIMAAAIAGNSPGGVLDVPLKVGLLTLGSLLASLIAFIYSLAMRRTQAPRPIPPRPAPTFDFVVLDALFIAVFVGVSQAVAQLLEMHQPYWVPISCLAVMQGMTLRAVWTKQIHRLIGTVGGLFLAWGLLLLPLNDWTVSLVMIALAFMIELLIVRHYALAAIFITPLTILLVEAATFGQIPASTLIAARFWDTALGCLVGLIGGACLHSPAIRGAVERLLKHLRPIAGTTPTR